MLEAFADTGASTVLVREGHFVFADGLEEGSSATTVDGRGPTPLFEDGPYLEGEEYLGGFWVIYAADLTEALSLAAQGSRACRTRSRSVRSRPRSRSEPPRSGPARTVTVRPTVDTT